MLLLRQFLSEWADFLTRWSPTWGNNSSSRIFDPGLVTSLMTSSKLAFQMAISAQRVIRSTSYGGGFRGRRIEWTYFRLEQIQDGGAPPSWKISNGHISGTGRPINFVFDPTVGFSGTADWMDLLPVVPNAGFGRPPSWKISNDHISGQHILRNLWSCGRWCHLSQMVTVQGNPRSAHTSSPTGLSNCLRVKIRTTSSFISAIRQSTVSRPENQAISATATTATWGMRSSCSAAQRQTVSLVSRVV